MRWRRSNESAVRPGTIESGTTVVPIRAASRGGPDGWSIAAESTTSATSLRSSPIVLPMRNWFISESSASSKCVILDRSFVTDAGLARLKKLTSLQELGLGGTGVSDAGIVHLEGLSHLTALGLEKTKVTDPCR